MMVCKIQQIRGELKNKRDRHHMRIIVKRLGTHYSKYQFLPSPCQTGIAKRSEIWYQ